MAVLAEIRTLKLNLLADVDQFGRGINQAETATTGLGITAKKVSAIASAAFIAMGTAAAYAAVKIGKDSVQAAIEDEASQKTLAKTLKNVTGATDDQIASTEKWITKQQFATGFTDSKLRPALSNLVRVTDDVTEAQKLTNLAMDISRGTGKDLETVSLALAKAHEGNLGALVKLGVPLDENIKKTGDFTAATDQLTQLFGGQASAYAETYQGKLDIVNTRLGELKESAGAGLLTILGNLLTVVNDVAKGFSGESGSLADSMSAVMREGYYQPNGAENLGAALQNVAEAMGQLFAEINGTPGQEGRSNLQTIADLLNKLASAIDAVNRSIDNAKNGSLFDKLKLSGGLGGLGLLFSGLGKANVSDFLNFGGGRANGGSVRAGQAYRVGEFGAETFIAGTSGRIVNGTGGNTIINISGAIDPEGVRRQLERLFQDSGRRTAAVNLAGSAF